MATRRRRLAPSIVSVTGTIQPSASGITVAGNGFDPFGGSVYLYANSDRTGASDQLTIGAQSDRELTVSVPGSLNNTDGTVYLFFQRRDLAWSRGFSVTLQSGASILQTKNLTIKLICNDATSLTSDESWIKDRIELLGHTVVLETDTATADPSGFDALVISPNSGTSFGTKYGHVPELLMKPQLLADRDYASEANLSGVSTDSIDIVRDSSKLAADLLQDDSPHTVFSTTSGTNFWYVPKADIAKDAVVIAEDAANNGVVLFYIGKNGHLLSGTVSPNLRIFLSFANTEDLTTNGALIFDACIEGLGSLWTQTRAGRTYFEYDGDFFEINSPAQLRQLQEIIAEIEKEEEAERILEQQAMRLAEKKQREFEAEQAMQRALTRQAKVAVERQRKLKEAYDRQMLELTERLVTQPSTRPTRIEFEKGVVRLRGRSLRV